MSVMNKKGECEIINKNYTYRQYAEDVITGKQVACQWVKLACKRFIDDINNTEQYEFREKEVNRAISFCSLFRHYEGVTAGQQFILEPFQQFIVANLIGIYHKGKDRRKYTQAYIQVARKNGKSFLISALALYFLIADNENAPQIFVGANARHQAAILFRMAQILSHQLDPENKVIEAYRYEIKCKRNNGFFKTISADASKQDGSCPSVAIIDEFHEAPTDELLNVLRSGQQTRQKPLTFIITTAGFDKSKPCYRMMLHSQDVLQGTVREDTLFAMIFTLDEGDDFHDKKVWVKSNPCLGKSVRYDAIAERVVEADNMSTKYIDVLTKNFNMWTDSATNWIPSVYVERSIRNNGWDDVYRPNITYIGVDLATVQDLSAVSFMTIQTDADGVERYYFRNAYFLPKDSLTKTDNNALYREWYDKGFLILTDGNVTDYDYILNYILSKSLNVAVVAYDSYNATQFAINATQQGLPMRPYSQAIGNFNQPTKFFEMMILSDRVRIDENPINAWCIKNVNIKMDCNGNTKPIKANHSPQKIDGAIAMLMAMGGYLSTSGFTGGEIV